MWNKLRKLLPVLAGIVALYLGLIQVITPIMPTMNGETVAFLAMAAFLLGLSIPAKV